MQNSVFYALFIVSFIVWESIYVNINVNSKVNSQSHPVQAFLEAGNYRVSPISAADGGAFHAWSAWLSTSCSNVNGCQQTIPTSVRGWINAYTVLSPHITAVSVEGTPLQPVSIEPDLASLSFFLMASEEAIYQADDSFVYPTAHSALARDPSSIFTPGYSRTVGFGIHDVRTLVDNRVSISLNMTPEAQNVTVNEPRDGASFASEDEIVFEGTAVNANGNSFPPSSLQWSSDRDGTLGTGQRLVIQASDLSVGSHTITCAAIDGRGMVIGTASFMITIVDDVMPLRHDSLYPGPQFSVGSGHPTSLAIADVDADRLLDILTASLVPGEVSVLRGNGDGTFQAQQLLVVGGRALAIADLNTDNVSDLITGSLNDVSVLLGNGDGTFQSRQVFAVSDGATSWICSVAVADLDADGFLDLVTANSGPDNVSILRGKGDGTFQVAQTLAIGEGVFLYELCSVVIADLDANGALDLVTANGDSNNVSVLRGNGDGTFQAARTFVAGNKPCAAAVGDLDGNGVPDLVTANADSNDVAVLLGHGDGTFRIPQTFLVGRKPCSVAVADVDANGVLDLVTADRLSHSVSVLRGIGDGTFQPAQPFATGSDPVRAAVADVDADGALDVVTASHNFRDVTVLLGNNDGTFQTMHNIDPGVSFSSNFFDGKVAAGDVDADGRLDLVVAGGRVTVLLSNGNGTFRTIQTSEAVGRMALGDVDADGHLDLISFGSGGVEVLRGNGDGTFQAAQISPVDNIPFALAIGDLNADGALDLAITAILNPRAGGEVSFLIGNGDGTFQAPQSFTVGRTPWSVAIADLNADGFMDIITLNLNNVTILFGNGDGTFQPSQSFAVGRGFLLTIADLDTDGRLDLVVAGFGALQVFLGNGDGTFRPAERITIIEGVNPIDAAVADVNTDGILDLVILNFSDDLTVVLGEGNGNFETQQTYAVGRRPFSLAVADLNGNGRPDLATANSDSDDVSILFHR